MAIVTSSLSVHLLVLMGDHVAVVTGGYRPFDLQNPITLPEMLQQLPRYTAASRSVYWIFTAADMVFPVGAALPLALLLAKALRRIGAHGPPVRCGAAALECLSPLSQVRHRGMDRQCQVAGARAKRLEETTSMAADNIRANQWRG